MINIEIIDFSCNLVKAHYFHHRTRFVKSPLRIFEKGKKEKKNEIKNLCAIHYKFLAAILQVLE